MAQPQMGCHVMAIQLSRHLHFAAGAVDAYGPGRFSLLLLAPCTDVLALANSVLPAQWNAYGQTLAHLFHPVPDVGTPYRTLGWPP